MSCSHTDVTEVARLDALRKLDVLDTPFSEAFDMITRMAAQLFRLPIAAVSLTDSNRQWFKSRVGIEHWSIPRMKAPCAQVADESCVLVIPDLQKDDYYHDSVLAASGIRFYAGAPLVTTDGYCLGAMCVLGNEPRDISDAERAALKDLAKMAMAQIELRHALGRVDPVSRLPNRAQFVDDFNDLALDRPYSEARLAAMINLASPSQLSHAVRAMGASYLDEIVSEAVRMLSSTVGKNGTVYHLSATEFAFIAPPHTELSEFTTMLETLLRERRTYVNSRFVTTATIGIAPFEFGITKCDDLLRNLYSAAQHALELDCGVLVFSPKQDDTYRRSFRLINDFGTALESDSQLRLVFQPKINLITGACVGTETLLRWTHPNLGEISPAEFIPLIEQTSMVREVTRWVLNRAIQQAARWCGEGMELRVAVNVSAVNLLEPDFCASVIESTQRYKLPVSCLELELTESALMTNPRMARTTMMELAAAGVHMSIDDFGTGYSSLAYLQSLPTQSVKIDRSFVLGIDSDERKKSLVASMVKLSQDFGHRVVAEGVETDTVAQVLRDIGCDEAQGYFYARPLSPTAFSDWFTQRFIY
jgi:EAL domain-containing protein (putative c-di-GMP-specific phosphodiesterase class I)/GGDEF domain-containing protein